MLEGAPNGSEQSLVVPEEAEPFFLHFTNFDGFPLMSFLSLL